ncbi:MAG: radical SAM protein [Flavobacteriales bacterium]|nr:radical SAM protein [Flavobacteriales bacterium]
MNLNPFRQRNKYDLTKASEEFTQDILKDFNAHRPNGPQSKICQAPFKNIYFAHRGKAVACCWNRSYVLGNYPERSIKEIWFGKEAEDLRLYISENNLEHGCQGCKSHILAGSYDVVKAKQYDQHRENTNHYPSVMEFELSNTCNLECEMCSGDFSSLIRKNREGRSPLMEPYDSAFVDQLEEFIPHLEEVKFYGGEPFLIEIYYEIWERIIKLNPSVRISVQTNCTTLNNRVKRIMEQSEFHIGLSIDSFVKPTYERIRKNAKYERTMENLQWFRQYCKERDTYFGISACAMQQNWHELADFVRKCNELESPVSLHTVFLPKKSSFQTLGKEELLRMIGILEKEEFPTDTPIEVKNKHHFEDLIRQLKHLVEEKEKKNPNGPKVETVEDLKQFVTAFISGHQAWSDSVKSERQKKILSKLRELEEALEKDFDYAEVFANWDFDNAVFLDYVLNDIETSDTHDLTSQFKSNYWVEHQ